MPEQPSTVTQWQIVSRTGYPITVALEGEDADLARAWATQFGPEVHLQTRTVTATPWKDVEDD